MELTQEHISTLAELIKADKRFTGNEDLFNAILEEAFKRTSLIAESLTTIEELTPYLRKLVSTSVLLVLKTSNRSTTDISTIPTEENSTTSNETLSENVSDEEIQLEETATQEEQVPEITEKVIQLPHEKKLDAKNEILSEPTSNQLKKDYNSINISFDDIFIADRTDEYAINPEFLKKVYETIINEHSNHLTQQYLQLYELRYVQKKTNIQIAQILDIPEQEVTKKLFDLVDTVKKSLI